MTEHWSDEITHEQLTTPEAKAVLTKYNSEDDFRVGAVNAMKMVGQPYRLPKSLDSLPDDNVRTEFHSGLSKLLGKDVTSIRSEEELADVNFADGLADARTVNKDLVTAFKQFAVQEKISKSLFAKIIKFSNSFGQVLTNKQAQDRQQTAQNELDAVRNTLAPLYGGDEGIKQATDAVRRMFQNHAGLTAEEYEKSAKAVIDNGLMRDASWAKAMFNLASKFKEGTTEGSSQQTTTPESTIKEEMPGTAKTLGW